MGIPRLLALVVPTVLGVLVAWACAAGEASLALDEPGLTKPAKESAHRLRVPGIVDEVLVKEGDKVVAGQALLREERKVEQAELKMYQVQLAASAVDIKIATAKNAMAKVEFKRIEELYLDKSGRVASVTEYEKAKLDVELTGLEIEKAQFEQRRARSQVERMEETVAAMELRSKIDGVVQKIDAKAGEGVDAQKGAVVVVNNDVLWVDINFFTAVSMTLRVGQELDVYYAGDKEQKVRKATVIFISPVVDAGSDRHLVRLEMENPEGKPSGLSVRVALRSVIAQQADGKSE